MSKKKLTSQKDDYSKWYNELVQNANLAENSGVRGCMVIKPYGYAIWEKIQQYLDKKFKETGHENAYFPLFVPKSFFSKEASHVDGFAKECAVVTHYRLKNNQNGEIIVDENAKLEEELIVRPTSETIIWDTYKRWIESYRDLPILINQWANVVRWEMRTRLFLRTSEFLWQEGHTAHSTKQEAEEEAKKMINVYYDFVENIMCIPVIKGTKTENEKFAGALDTYCIEALMQDGKALQAGTSHFLGQNFAKAFDVKFTSKDGKQEYVWATSWGISTRLIGALIMTHSDDNGLVLPPKLAPIQVVIIPIYKNEEEKKLVEILANKYILELRQKEISVKYDNRDDISPGWKFNEYELKGIPVRITIGARDLKNNIVEISRRDTSLKESVNNEIITEYVTNLLENIQVEMLQKAKKFRDSNIHKVNAWEEFLDVMNNKGGFAYCHWDGTKETEDKIKELTKATIRCIPEDFIEEKGKCILTGKNSNGRVLFAKAY